MNAEEYTQWQKHELFEQVRECIKAEPELPGTPPEEMLKLWQEDQEDLVNCMRACVRATKDNILARITLLEKGEPYDTERV
jgi:hypothetical protein